MTRKHEYKDLNIQLPKIHDYKDLKIKQKRMGEREINRPLQRKASK